MTEEQIAKLPKHRKDWLECFGNQWAPAKTAGVACLACVYGDRHGYGHGPECRKPKPVDTGALLSAYLRRISESIQ